MNWYAVKTFYRAVSTGRPRERDAAYDNSIASLEERIVLFKARSGQSAIRKGVAEARRYAKRSTWTNGYGQTVQTEFLEIAESYEVDGEIREGTEIFSSLETIARTESAKAIGARKLGCPPSLSSMRQFMPGGIVARLDEELGERWRKS